MFDAAAGRDISDDELWNFLRSSVLLRFDFLNDPSHNLATTVHGWYHRTRTVGEPPALVIAGNNFRNVPEVMATDTTLRDILLARPEQFFIRQS